MAAAERVAAAAERDQNQEVPKLPGVTQSLSIGHLGTKFIEIFMEIKTFSLMKLYLKILLAEVAAILSSLNDAIW